MPAYKVLHKGIYRATTVDTVMGTHPDGSSLVVRQNGPIEFYPVGTVFTDMREDELAAFGDRLALIDDAEAAFWQERQAARSVETAEEAPVDPEPPAPVSEEAPVDPEPPTPSSRGQSRRGRHESGDDA